jgi:hypothetical protein
MENLNNDPVDEQITNDDNSVTNKDGDNMLEQEEGANVQNKPDEVRVPTVTPGTEDADTEDDKSKEAEVDPSNTDAGPKGENL